MEELEKRFVNENKKIDARIGRWKEDIKERMVVTALEYESRVDAM